MKAIFTLLRNDIDGGSVIKLTEEQHYVLEIERELYLSGKVKPYSKEETLELLSR